MRSAGKGQVLRVKYGLNANSGAIGCSFLPCLPRFLCLLPWWPAFRLCCIQRSWTRSTKAVR